ncbi:maleate cis-trans isomerase family protein [Ornithinicoccus hortensis]|uniref:Maleate cis-trans isomerase n=1 Tax=Ornithinicoccus hortensis TaxID=82346 RepID=A0A542YW68_9MICO|nr:maleate cis-trans isomerase [Ornithinicoccus hortensis]TQL52338.1 maleate cis-trans isomerase [Ornithinicoccus hortensis]
MTTVGLLYPGHSAEDDFPALQARLGDRIRLPLVHTSVGEDAHRVDALLDLGGHDRLVEGARELTSAHRPDAVMWACTSGSFVFGWDGAREQVDRLAQATGLPTSSTSIAFVNAAHDLGLRRVAVAASYPQDVAEHFVSFLQRGGIEVLSMGSHGIVTAAEVGTLGREQVAAIVAGADREGADAVLVPDTAMHTLAWLDHLEEVAGMPVLTANQVTVWEGLRLTGRGVPDDLTGLGTLFRPRVAR